MSIRVFVSSTFTDLRAHRARAILQLRSAGFHVDPMEDWPAEATEPTHFCPERVRDCRLCVLLVSFRRGWVPDGANRSITQLEYDEAARLGIDVLPFLLADDAPGWPEEHDQRADPTVRAWRDEVRPQSGSERFHFGTAPASIDLPLAAALARWQDRQEERRRLADYLNCVRDAHRSINFLGLPTFKENPDVEIADLFVEPALAAHFADPDRPPGDWAGVAPLFDVVDRNPRLVVLGDPGTGKSTLVNWIVHQLARDGRTPWKARFGDPIPLPFVLRDLGIGRGITWDALLDKFLARPGHNLLKRDHLVRLLENGAAMPFLDGLDEIGDVATRRDLRDAVHDGLRRYPNCRWLLTSRIVGYDEVPFHLLAEAADALPTDARWRDAAQPMVVCYAAPFDDPRIEEFAGKWYALRERDPFKVARGAKDLVDAVRRDPDTLRLGRVPNLLTMMALVHRVKAALPHGKALLYEYVAEAYLETIDKYRKMPGDADRLRDKKRWLGRVAFEMQLRRAAARTDQWEQANAIVVDGAAVRGWIAAAMTDSDGAPDPDDPARFLDRVRRRSGLMIERSPDRFAFTHLSFLEYFAAVYLRESVTSAEWLTGDEVAPGTSAADLRRYGNQTTWQVALVFLFELLGEESRMGRKKVREAVFGPDWEVVGLADVRRAPPAVLLLTQLGIDPHVGWEPAARTTARDRCLDWIVALQRQGWTLSGSEILRAYLSGERDSLIERLGCLAERWARGDVDFLYLDGTAIADVGPLSRLRALKVLSLERTRVTDLSPLAGLTNLGFLYLDGTGVSDLSSLAALGGLELLSLENTRVGNLDPLAGLTGLQVLSLENTPVTNLRPLAGLRALKVLFLGHTAVRDLRPLAALTGLRELRLEGTQVADLTPLRGLDGLQVLFLQDTPVSEIEIWRLKARLPELHISR